MTTPTANVAGAGFPPAVDFSGRGPLTGLSFYSGAMGLDLGLEVSAGVRFLLAADIDPAARATIKANRPGIHVLADARISAAQAREAAGIGPDDVIDVVAGCPPCPPFSVAGKRRGVNDPRGMLLPQFVDLAIALNPTVIVHENVKGLTSAKLGDEKGGVLGLVEYELRRNGYRVSWHVWNAADFGACQSRERVILIASRDVDPAPLVPTHSRDGAGGLPRWRTLRDGLAGLPETPCDYVAYSQARRETYALLRPGQNWRDLPERLGRACHSSGGGHTGHFLRLAWDRPCPTLLCSPTYVSTGRCHPEEERPLSVQEYARIQGFPDDWRIEGSIRDRYRQIGNAVPVPLSTAVGAAVAKTLGLTPLPPARAEPSAMEAAPPAAVTLSCECTSKKVTFLDLFAGIGAGRKGFEDACRRIGIEPVCVGFSETDQHAVDVYLRHFPGTPELGDIRELAKSDSVPKCDLAMGGFPCQGNSRAGRRLGLDDPRSQLVFDMIEVSRRSGAKAFVGENVDHLVTQNGGEDLRTILDAIREAGFSARHSVINSRDHGVAQNRSRVYIAGFRDDVEFTFPQPTDSSKRLRDVIDAEPVDPRYYVSEASLAGMRDRKARHLAKGNGFGFVIRGEADVAGALVCGGMGREGNLLVDRRISEFPALPRRRSPLNGECIRNMTPEEWERLQGLPTGWTAGQSDGHRYRQLGNAMSVPVIEAISSKMLEALGRGPRHMPAPNEITSSCGTADGEDKAGYSEAAIRTGEPTLTFVDLCAGIGGFRLAMEAVGGRCVMSSEFDPVARRVYHANFGDWPWGDLRRIQGADVPDHDVLCAGFPCQPFSISGDQRGFEDRQRGTVFFEIARIIEAKKPAAVFLENVPHLLKHDDGRTLALIRETLEGMGYSVSWAVLNASRYGVPTARERIYIVALRSDLGMASFEFPEPTMETVKLRDVLLPDSETGHLVVTGRPIEIDEDAVARASAAGVLDTVQVGIVGTTRPAKQGYRIYGENGHAITFCARGGGIGAKTGLYLVNGRVRRLDPREGLRVMGYPDSFVIPASIKPDQARTLIGNTVVVPLVRKVLESSLAAASIRGIPVISSGRPSQAVIRYGSVCSGIEAATVAWEPLGWKPAWFSEIAPFQSAVLMRHYPEVPNLGDMTKLHERQEFVDGKIEMLVGGTPCPSFSTAGNRRGMDDFQGQLALTFVELLVAKQPRWFLWENVAGVLSSKRGADFAAFLKAIRAAGYSCSFRVLDAQYFGVPQRRRRVYVVGHRDDWRAPVEVLFESKDRPDGHGKKRTPRVIRSRLEEPGLPVGVDTYNMAVTGDVTATLGAHSYNGAGMGPKIMDGRGIRTVTAAEAERLQGFPPDYTLVEFPCRTRAALDRRRIGAIGNSMAVPVMRWIGERIARFEAASSSGAIDGGEGWSDTVARGDSVLPPAGGFRNSGIMSPAGCRTFTTDESPAEIVPSSLRDVVEPGDLPAQLYLSPEVCRTTLRKAEKTGKVLDPIFRDVLRKQAGL